MNPLRPCRPMPPPRARGFTMIELMVTITVAGILLSLAVPGMQNLLAGRAVAAQTDDVLAALHFARAEAMKRGSPVTVCRTTAAAPTTCDTAGTGTWQYWMIFAETPATFNGKLDAADTPLRVQSSVAGKVTYDTIPTASPKYYSFQGTGIVISDSTTLGDVPPTPIITITPKLDSASPSYKLYERQICLNKQGRAMAVDGNKSCSS